MHPLRSDFNHRFVSHMDLEGELRLFNEGFAALLHLDTVNDQHPVYAAELNNLRTQHPTQAAELEKWRRGQQNQNH